MSVRDNAPRASDDKDEDGNDEDGNDDGAIAYAVLVKNALGPVLTDQCKRLLITERRRSVNSRNTTQKKYSGSLLVCPQVQVSGGECNQSARPS